MPIQVDYEEIFRERLKAARAMRKLSQSELAKLAGFHPSAISHFERTKTTKGTKKKKGRTKMTKGAKKKGRSEEEKKGRRPSLRNLRRLADALNVPVGYLLGRDDKQKELSPLAEKLVSYLESMTRTDQETLADFAKMLAKKKEPSASSSLESGVG